MYDYHSSAAACNHKELINPQLACHSSGMLTEAPSLPQVCPLLLFQTHLVTSLLLIFAFSKHRAHCTGSRKSQFQPGATLNTQVLSCPMWSLITLHFCTCHSNRCSCSLMPTEVCEELASVPASTVFQTPC